MSKFKIIPLSKQYAEKIRRTGIDDFGHKVIKEIATGHGPCRVSLKPFQPGKDKRLLIKHSPFEIDNAFNQPGPVFIMAEEVEEYKDVSRFPEEIKNDKIHFHLTLIGYSSDQKMIYTKLVEDNDVDELISKIFDQRPEIEYLHVRSAEAACFICKIVRISSEVLKF